MQSEANSELVRPIILGCTGVLITLPCLTFIFGVSPIVTLTILLCFVIVLLTAAGCSLHIREIERLEEAEAIEKMREKIDLHSQMIQEVISDARPRVETCERILVEQPGRLDGDVKNIATARRLLSALEQRLEQIVRLSSESTEEQVLTAHELTDEKLRVPKDVQNSVVDADSIPDLESHLWRDTLEMLLLQAEKQLKQKTDIAA